MMWYGKAVCGGLIILCVAIPLVVGGGGTNVTHMKPMGLCESLVEYQKVSYPIYKLEYDVITPYTTKYCLMVYIIA